MTLSTISCRADAGPARAERQARRQLLQPRARPHEREVGHVDAPDEQHEERAAPHQVQRRPYLADQGLLEQRDGGVKPRVDQQRFQLRKEIQVSLIERVDLLLRARDRRAGLQSGDVLIAVAVALLVGLLLRRERERAPEHHVGIEKIEALRHDAHDRVQLAVEADLFADGIWSAAKLGLPERVAQNQFLVVADFAVLFREGAAQRRSDTQQPEERRRRLGHPDANRSAVLIDARVAAVVAGPALRTRRSRAGGRSSQEPPTRCRGPRRRRRRDRRCPSARYGRIPARAAVSAGRCGPPRRAPYSRRCTRRASTAPSA